MIPTEVMLKAIGKDETQLDSILEEWNIPLGRPRHSRDYFSSACAPHKFECDLSRLKCGEILRVGAKPR